MALKIGDVWEETRAFARAELALWTPVAFLCWGLPALIPDAYMPTLTGMAKGQLTPAMGVLELASGLLQLLGQLALAALVLQPGQTVGDALRTAGRRYGPALLTVLVLALCLIAYILAASVVLLALGVRIVPGAGAGAVGPGVASLLPLLVVPLLVAGIRLTTLWPAHISRGRGGWGAITTALRETAPVAWRLALLMVAFFVALDLLLIAVNAGLGSLARLLALLLGTSAPGDAAVGLVQATIVAAGSGFWALFATHLHRHLSTAPRSAVFE